VFLFNQIYNQESSCRQNGADDAMVVETANERYKNRTGGFEFKCFHWWEAVRHQPKWRAKSASSLTTDPWISSSDPTTEEEVTRPMGWDRVKASMRKGKEKEGSSSICSCNSICCLKFVVQKMNYEIVKSEMVMLTERERRLT
jgi:hypothetical protein